MFKSPRYFQKNRGNLTSVSSKISQIKWNVEKLEQFFYYFEGESVIVYLRILYK